MHTLGGKLRLFFLPPYSPDRNPDELVWKHLKADTVGRMAMTSKVDFTKKVRRSMRDLQNDARTGPPRGKIRSFLNIGRCPELLPFVPARIPLRAVSRCNGFFGVWSQLTARNCA